MLVLALQVPGLVQQDGGTFGVVLRVGEKSRSRA